MLAYTFIMGFSYASLAIYLAFMERRISAGLLRFVSLGSVLLLAGIPAGLFLPWGSDAQLAHYGFYDNFGLVFILLELGLMIALPLGARRFQDAERRRIAQAFSLLYLSRYPVVAALALLPQPFRLVFALAYPNVVPYLWLRFIVLPHAERTAAREAMKSDMEWVGQRYGLSPRERQVLGLLLAGKSNRDMEESLFISYHTVKNHVYNIYRKLGVKTRFELLHLVARSHAGERAGDP
jgi:DNA-binding CsgD family transcriptional regulator